MTAPMAARDQRRDRGFATLVVLALSAALLALGALLATVGAVAVARHRAAAAADLAALAAAGQLLEGSVGACRSAVRVAAAQGASVRSCSSDGASVTVVAEVRPAGPLGLLGAARSTARAGPGPLADRRARRDMRNSGEGVGHRKLGTTG